MKHKKFLNIIKNNYFLDLLFYKNTSTLRKQISFLQNFNTISHECMLSSITRLIISDYCNLKKLAVTIFIVDIISGIVSSFIIQVITQNTKVHIMYMYVCISLNGAA